MTELADLKQAYRASELPFRPSTVHEQRLAHSVPGRPYQLQVAVAAAWGLVCLTFEHLCA